MILENKGKSELAAYNRFRAKLNHLSLIWKRLEDETITNESYINLIVKRAKEGASIGVDEIHRLSINSQFLSLDLEDFVIHARILMDRVAVLVAYLIEGPARSLQHASFHKHRRFFLDPKNIPYNPDEEYARYIWEQTGWFEIMLRDARDILIVHDNSLHGAGLLSGP